MPEFDSNLTTKVGNTEILFRKFSLSAGGFSSPHSTTCYAIVSRHRVDSRVETKHRIARNLARIARKFTRSTKIEIEMLEKKIARFLLGSKEDRKFYARDRSDRTSVLEMIARKLKLKLHKKKLTKIALFVL